MAASKNPRKIKTSKTRYLKIQNNQNFSKNNATNTKSSKNGKKPKKSNNPETSKFEKGPVRFCHSARKTKSLKLDL